MSLLCKNQSTFTFIVFQETGTKYYDFIWIYHISVVGRHHVSLFHCIFEVEINYIQFHNVVVYLLCQSVYIYFHCILLD